VRLAAPALDLVCVLPHTQLPPPRTTAITATDATTITTHSPTHPARPPARPAERADGLKRGAPGGQGGDPGLEDSDGGGGSFIVSEGQVARRAAARKRRKVRGWVAGAGGWVAGWMGGWVDGGWWLGGWRIGDGVSGGWRLVARLRLACCVAARRGVQPLAPPRAPPACKPTGSCSRNPLPRPPHRPQVALDAAAALLPRINLAELAPRPQAPLQPGSTPACAPGEGRSGHFLALSMVGAVISRNLGDHNSIEVRLAGRLGLDGGCAGWRLAGGWGWRGAGGWGWRGAGGRLGSCRGLYGHGQLRPRQRLAAGAARRPRLPFDPPGAACLCPPAQVQFHDVTVMRKRVPLLTDYFGLFAGALGVVGVRGCLVVVVVGGGAGAWWRAWWLPAWGLVAAAAGAAAARRGA
jgi:hypothetical protein